MSGSDELVEFTVIIPRWQAVKLTLEAEEQGILPAELGGLRLSMASFLDEWDTDDTSEGDCRDIPS